MQYQTSVSPVVIHKSIRYPQCFLKFYLYILHRTQNESSHVADKQFMLHKTTRNVHDAVVKI